MPTKTIQPIRRKITRKKIIVKRGLRRSPKVNPMNIQKMPNQPKTELELAEIKIKKLRNEIHKLRSLLIKYNETNETSKKGFGRS